MEEQFTRRKGYGLIRNFGWKKNLLAFAAGAALFFLLDLIDNVFAGTQLVSLFDFSVAFMPLIGFVLSGWGILGCILANLYLLVRYVPIEMFTDPELLVLVLSRLFGLTVYCVLPSVLWYAFPLKEDDRVRYPRMDTAAHVLKYYLIMIASVAVYVASLCLISLLLYQETNFLDYVATFTQYLDVVLIIGLPLLIVVSLIYHKTITINERLVLAFLLIGVLASLLSGALVYFSARRSYPELFNDWGALLKKMGSSEFTEWNDSYNAVYERYLRFWNGFYIVITIMLNLLLIVEIVLMHRIEKKVTKPILHLADVLDEYTQQEEKASASQAVVEKCAPYRVGYGEVSGLTGTCVEMVEEINRYTDNLQSVTGDRERIHAELDISSKIQRAMLPNVFPPFPDRPEIDLYASMTPAREVGGDFYNFCLLDQDHLALTIADVSGKGVPAALFMVISMTLLNDYAQSSRSPREILSYANHQLVQHNDSMMFCTVWLGILNLRTGRLVASNAGHEYPAIRRNGGQYELFVDTHTAPLGFRDGLQFKEYETILYPGDCLFEYTDGVTEATDASEELFGEERMLAALNGQQDADPEEQIRRMYDAINDFAKDAPQFDDITMLCVRYNGSAAEPSGSEVSLTVPAKRDSVTAVTDFVTEQLEAVNCPDSILFNFSLVVEEICVNIANYAYVGRDENGSMTVSFSWQEEGRLAELVFSDSGIPFDPTARPAPDISLAPEAREIGGLGIHIVKTVMDEVTYKYYGGQNILTVRKHLPLPDPAE